MCGPRLGRAIVAGHRAPARRGRQQAGEHLDGGGLARAVGSEETEYLAAPHLEAHLVHRHEVAEATRERLGRHRDGGGLCVHGVAPDDGVTEAAAVMRSIKTSSKEASARAMDSTCSATGVSRASTRPSCSKAMRSKRSASSM